MSSPTPIGVFIDALMVATDTHFGPAPRLLRTDQLIERVDLDLWQDCLVIYFEDGSERIEPEAFLQLVQETCGNGDRRTRWFVNIGVSRVEVWALADLAAIARWDGGRRGATVLA